MRNNRNMRKPFHFSGFRCAAHLLRKSMYIKIHKYIFEESALSREIQILPTAVAVAVAAAAFGMDFCRCCGIRLV